MAVAPSVSTASPIFVGRATLLRTLQVNLPLGRSYVVLGGPKTGRTALLQRMTAWQKQQARSTGAALATWIPVTLDLRTARPDRPQFMVDALWTALTKAVLDPWVQGTDIIPRAENIDFRREKDPWTRFDAACETLWAALAHTPGWCRWALFCDNAEVLAQAGVARSIAEHLVGWCDLQRAHRPTSVLWAGAPTMLDLLATPSGPLAELRRLPMGALRDAEAQAMYRAYGRPDLPADAPLEVLMQLSGKHPWLLQRLFEAAQAQPEGSLEAYQQTCRADAEALFAEYLALLGPLYDARGEPSTMHALLQALLSAGGDIPVEQAERTLGLRPVKDAIEFLESLAIVEKTVRGNTPTVRAANIWWNNWYQQNVGLGVMP